MCVCVCNTYVHYSDKSKFQLFALFIFFIELSLKIICNRP